MFYKVSFIQNLSFFVSVFCNQNNGLDAGAITSSDWLCLLGASWSESLPILPLLQVRVSPSLSRLEELRPGLLPEDGQGRLQ